MPERQHHREKRLGRQQNRFFRFFLHALPLLLFCLAVDRWATKNGTIGWERGAVDGGLRRIFKKPDASGVVLLGSSTSADWLPLRTLSRAFDEPRREIVDAHINGCHQGCTFAEVQRLLAEGRHFKVAVFGTNQFQMCEHPHSKRVLQHRMMIPLADVPKLFSLYFQSSDPLGYVGRFLGGAILESYADTAVFRKLVAEKLAPHLSDYRKHRWAKKRLKKPNARKLCAYGRKDVQYKKVVSEELIESLSKLADEVYILLLPDRYSKSKKRDIRRSWQAHRKLHKELTNTSPQVHLIDLSQGEIGKAKHFKDGFHLKNRHKSTQARAFIEAVAAIRSEKPEEDSK